jgi:hypothetical protein
MPEVGRWLRWMPTGRMMDLVIDLTSLSGDVVDRQQRLLVGFQFPFGAAGKQSHLLLSNNSTSHVLVFLFQHLAIALGLRHCFHHKIRYYLLSYKK